MDHDLEAVIGDPEAVERHARANIEALRGELEAGLRSELAHLGWDGKVLVEDDPHLYLAGPGQLPFLLSTSTEPPGATYGWEKKSVLMPGVPPDVVRAAADGDRWAPRADGTRLSWDELLRWLTEDAVRWEMYLVNILAFLDDVAARGGPRVEGRELSVDVDSAGGDDVEPYWVPVGGERLTVFMHGDVLGRDSTQPVGLDDEDYFSWNEAVDAFVRLAAEVAA
ncbi:hypothetical protein AB0L25_16950 [Spirillospora sp. NPDC052242]